MCVGCLACRYHSGFACLSVSIANVVEDGASEQDGFLWHQRNLSIPTVEGHVPQISSVDGQAPFYWIVEPMQQIDHRGFPGTGWPDEGDQFTRFRLKR